MSTIEKKIKKFFENPAYFKFPDIENILFHFGFEKINTKGSHIKFKHYKLRDDLIIPVHNNDCKDFYKTLAKEKIKNLI